MRASWQNLPWLVAATLVAAPCLAQSGRQDWADPLFGMGGGAESVKTETADPPKVPIPALSKGDKGDRGDPGEAGQAGAPGKNGKDGRDGKGGKTTVVTKTRTLLRTVVRTIPHPKVTLGHHAGAGHEGVYKEVARWRPASVSFAEKRDITCALMLLLVFAAAFFCIGAAIRKS